MAYSLGIDLGTTLSAAATARDGLIEIVQLGEGTATMPSIVVVRADVEVLVGDAAERASANEPARTARGFKRRLGDPNPIVLGGKPYGAESLLAQLLRAIVARVSDAAGGPPDSIVLTHPASYGPDKIALLEQAVRQAGIDNVTFLTEPEAAAIHDDQREPLTVGSVVAVYDFGGGTFDAAILRKTETGFELLGTPEEMEHLGGIDFDEAFSSSVVGFVSANGIAWTRTTRRRPPRSHACGTRVGGPRKSCRPKRETTVHVDLPGFQTDLPLTREDFEDLVRPRIAETIGALARATESAGMTFHGLDRILLIGGSSQIPLVAEMVGEATGRPITIDADSKGSIALGAAFVAEQRRLAAVTDAAAAAAAAGVVGTGSILGMEAAAAMDAVVGEEAPAAPADGAAPRPKPPRSSPPERAPRRTGGGRSPRRPGSAPWSSSCSSRPAPPGCSQAPRRRARRRRGARQRGALDRPSAFPAPSTSTTPTTTPLASPSASASPSATPAGRQARITGIAITDGRYVVDYQTFGYTPALPGTHMHFFFNTVSVADAGVPGAGPWFLYAGPAPFTGYKVSDKPADASQMCILVANPDHSIIPDTGNCMRLP